MEHKTKFHSARNITSLKDMLSQSVELFKDRTAFLVKTERGGQYHHIKYTQVKSDVEALGTKLLNMGLEGKRIAIIGENCYQWIIAYLAVVNGVGTAVPLDKELTKDEIHKLLSVAECEAVFYTDSYEDVIREYPIRYKVKMKIYEGSDTVKDDVDVIRWGALIAEGKRMVTAGNRDFVDCVIDPEEMRMLLFSSGTTGIPKGIMLCHRNVVSNMMDTRKIVDVKPEDRTLSILPIHHTFECTLGLLTVLYSGASVAFFEGLKYVAKNLEEARATILLGVPLIFESIYNKIWRQADKNGKSRALKKAVKFNRVLKAFGISAERMLFRPIHESFGGRLRMMVTGAASIDPNVIRGFEDFGIRMLQGYGLTECSPLVAGTPDFSADTYKKAGSVGCVIQSGKLKIIEQDEDGIGEIVFKGPNVMLGYYKMPAETDKVLKDEWFYTGDLGFLDEKGWLYITGRKKNVIVTKTGKNIYPEELEVYLSRSKYIRESMVYGVRRDEDDGTVVGVQIRPDYDVILDEYGKNLDDDSIFKLIKKTITEINEGLPVYKRIRDLSIRKDEFIKTTTKKIKRFKNMEKATP